MVNKEIKCIILAAILASLSDWGFFLLNPAYPSLVDAFSVSPQLVSLVVSLYSFPGIFISPLYGILSDKHGRKTVLLPLLVIFGSSGCLAGLVSNFEVLLLLRIIQGIAAAGFYPMAFIILGDLFIGDKRSKAVGEMISISWVIAIFVPLLGGYLVTYSWRFPFFAFGWAFIVFIALYKALPETLPVTTYPKHPETLHQESNPSTNQPKIRKNNETMPHTLDSVKFAILGVLILGTIHFLVIFGGVNLFTSFYVENGLNGTPAFTGLIQSIQSIFSVLIAVTMGFWMSRYGKPKLELIGLVLIGFGCLCLSFPPDLMWLYSSVVTIGIGKGITSIALNAYVLDLAPLKIRGTITATHQSMIKLGQSIGPYLFATYFIIMNNRIEAPFLLATGLSIIGSVITIPLIYYTQKTGIGSPEKDSAHIPND